MPAFIFIDGASLLSAVKQLAHSILGSDNTDDLLDFDSISYPYDRLFYYDALPSKTKGETPEQFEMKKKAKLAFFSKINHSNKCHVHQSFSRYRRKTGQEQKGVDVLLAIEVLQHAYQGNIDKAVIVTSDLDFTPIFDALTQTRVTTELIYQKGCTAEDLISSADIAIPMTLNLISSWFRQPHRKKLSVWSSGMSMPADYYRVVKHINLCGYDITIGTMLVNDPGACVALFTHGDENRFIVGGSEEAIKESFELNPDYNCNTSA